MLCGSKDLDGYAFCAGVQGLDVSDGTHHPVLRLIKPSIFRSSHAQKGQDGSSLSVYRLGELLDFYHIYEASKQHDKIYALLGMSTDNLSEAGLSPDYAVPWAQLLDQVTRHVLGVEIQVYTWSHREIAIISGWGWLVGRAISRRKNEVLWKDSAGQTFYCLNTASLESIRVGDIACHLQGAPGVSIVRQGKDFLLVIRTNVYLSPTRSSATGTVLTYPSVSARSRFCGIGN